MPRAAFAAPLVPAARPPRARAACGMSAAARPPAASLVQYVVVRRDLGWPAGSVAAQAVHACVAAVWASRADGATQEYCGPGGAGGAQMRTVVLAADGEGDCVRLAESLAESGVRHAVWREQPEDCVTAVAAAPYPQDVVKPLFTKFGLLK